MTRQMPWITGIVLYGAGGLIALAAALIAPNVVSTSIRWLAVMAIAMSLFCVYGLKHLLHARWGSPVRVVVGIAIIFTGGQFSGSVALAMAVLLLFPLVSAAYMYAPRVSLTYLALGTAALIASIYQPDLERWNLAHTIVTTVVVVTIISALILSQVRTRSLIRMHRGLAFSDPLTGLENTRHLEQSTQHELEDMRTSDRVPALFAIDLDNFKQVNDEFDHRTGDEVLIAVADVLRARTEAQDVVARRGGDEFSVLVPAVRDRDLDELRDNIRSAIVAARKRVCPQITPTASVGYVLAQPTDNFESLLARADDELHAQKRSFHASQPGRRRHGEEVVDIARKRSSASEAAREKSISVGPMVRLGGEPWFILSSIAAIIALLITGVAAAGLTGPLGALDGAAVGGGMLVYVATCWAGSRINSHDSLKVHVMFFAMLALVTTAVLLAGPAGSSLLDIYMLVAILTFFVFAPLPAAAWLVVSLGATVTIAFMGRFANAEARVAATSLIVVVVAGLFAKIRSLTMKYVDQNVELSNRDPLTGLANVRVLREQVVKRMRAAGDGRVAIIAIDLDDFKSVNDTVSHSFGNTLLREVANAIKSAVEQGDLVARRGGDEFYVVCAHSDYFAVDATAKRVGEAIEAARLAICAGLNPSATVATVVSEPGDDAATLLYRADVALHAGKLRTHEAHGQHLGNAS